MKKFGLIFFLSALVVGCYKEKPKEKIVFEEEVFDAADSYAHLGFAKLSEYNFFQGDIADLIPASNVYPYDLNTPLFSDYALKKRFIYLPEGSKVGYHETDVLKFPPGTVLIKNFYYENAQLENELGRIMETRLLIRKEEGWTALPYIWNEEQTDASLEITGGTQKVSLLGKNPIDYQVPNLGQCKGCHELNGKIEPIGPTARQLNRTNIFNGKEMNQLVKLYEDQLLDLPAFDNIPKLPVWDNPKTGSLNKRARAYLEINCAHCLRREGPAKNSGLYLLASNENESEIGVMKAPVAAGQGSGGLKYDIVPGKPEKSIFYHRLNSTEASVMMPELGRKLIHEEGVMLIKEWIANMN